MRASMDEYIGFPVANRDDFRELKKRFDPHLQGRYPPMWKKLHLSGWQNRQHVLILGLQLLARWAFTGARREWMGTVKVCPTLGMTSPI